MNKITVSNQAYEDEPTLGSIKPGTIFQFPSNENWDKPESWRIKTNKNSYVHLSVGSCHDIKEPYNSNDSVIPLVGSICIEPE